jgi:hypothetical protein
MIIVRISGGLGNQLFQYALARSIKEKTGYDVRLDSHYFNHQNTNEAKREYGLTAFAISLPEATPKDLQDIGFHYIHSKSKLHAMLRKLGMIQDYGKAWYQKRYIIEPSFDYHEEMNGMLNTKSYISGIWQSEKYFSSISSILKKELVLKDGLQSTAKNIQAAINQSHSVSVHIRRGDYVGLTKLRPLGLDYYTQATAYIKTNIKKPHFFVFSDDSEWVKNNFTLPGDVTFVSSTGSNQITPSEELILMSSCAHNIIANSSFSWWGAWLNNHEAKIIIAPKNWYTVAINTRDLVPNSWIRIENSFM